MKRDSVAAVCREFIRRYSNLRQIAGGYLGDDWEAGTCLERAALREELRKCGDNIAQAVVNITRRCRNLPDIENIILIGAGVDLAQEILQDMEEQDNERKSLQVTDKPRNGGKVTARAGVMGAACDRRGRRAPGIPQISAQ